MIDAYRAHLQQTLDSIRAAGTWKAERMIGSPQSAWIQTSDGRRVLNMCANNYLGLADHPEVIAASHAAVEQWGYGLASVRFICGTQTLHRELECDLTGFLGTEDTILYSSCFDANGGLFETILGPEDAVISSTESASARRSATATRTGISRISRPGSTRPGPPGPAFC